jgi:phosphomannomutase
MIGKIFGSYDIRGLYGKDFDDSFAYKLGHALAQYIAPSTSSRFLIGFDSRFSSPGLANSLRQGLCEAGQKVTLIGMASTPRLSWEGVDGQYDCSIAVTASHLSAAHNGFKISALGGVSLSSESGLRVVEALVDTPIKVRTGGKEETYSSSRFYAYIKALSSHLNVGRKIRVVVDGGGSPIGPEVEALFDSVELVTVHGIDLLPSGSFLRRSPNPLDKGALKDLSESVAENKAAFGVAFDGDGDRIVVVDEKGVFVDPDLITALLAGRILERQPGSTIMYDLRSSRAVAEHIQRLGGKPLKCRVGHSLIKSDMRGKGAIFAGELSAHYYWADLYNTDNALRVLVELVSLLSQADSTLSQLIQPLRVYFNSGEINFKVADVDSVMKLLAANHIGGKQDWLDGLSVEFENWWFNVRASQTEPLLRLCVGACDRASLELQIKSLTNLITDSAKTSSPSRS